MEELGKPRRHAYVVDDDDDFRNSMLLLLEAAGWVGTGFASAMAFLQESDDLRPGVVLLDIRMPKFGGLELLETEQRRLAKFATVMVTGHGDVDSAVRSLKSGAVDFIEKPFGHQDLLAILDLNHRRLVEDADANETRRRALEKISQLSPREHDVLRGFLGGASHKAIARELGISDRTVEMHRNNVVRKLGAKSTKEAIHIGTIGGMSPSFGAR